MTGSLEIAPAYPLRWPDGRPRTADRKPALFRADGRAMTYTTARRRLLEQFWLMRRHGQPFRTTSLVLSTNIRFTASGARDKNFLREPADPGVAFYFDLDRRAHVLACDRWDTVAGNIAAIAAHVDALRGQERWGVADLRQAFAGHVALPAPGQASALPWRFVFGFGAADAVTRDRLDAEYRRLARAAHPDAGGDRAAWDRLTAAYEQAKREVASAR